MIWILEKYTTHEKHWFTQDRSQAIHEWLKNKEEVSYNEDEMHQYTYGQDQDSTQSMIDKAKSHQIDPIVWAVHHTRKKRLYNNTLPIQRKVWDLANMLVYKIHLEIMKANPHARLVRLKTDLLGYVNITREIETDDDTWGRVKRVWDPPKPGSLHDPALYVRKTKFIYNRPNWNIHKRIILDDDDIKSIFKKGGLIFGKAGTGKSTTLNKIKDVLATDSASPSVLKTCAYTHKASKIVDGNTLHLVFGIDMKTHEVDYKK